MILASLPYSQGLIFSIITNITNSLIPTPYYDDISFENESNSLDLGLVSAKVRITSHKATIFTINDDFFPV